MTNPSYHFGLSFLILAFYLPACRGVVSKACQEETNLIQSYSSVQEELKLVMHAPANTNVEECNFTSLTTFNCSIHYEALQEAANTYKTFCDKAKGQMILRSLDIGHSLGFFAFNVSVKGILQCVGVSCQSGSVEKGDLQNDVFVDFIQEMEVGDLCDPSSEESWGELDFWSSIGVKIASWAGIDLTECFKTEDEDDKGTGRKKRKRLR